MIEFKVCVDLLFFSIVENVANFLVILHEADFAETGFLLELLLLV